MSERVNRRTALRIGALGVAAGLAGCSGQSLGAGSSFQSQIDEVTTQTEQYADPRAAMEDGFAPTGPAIPGQGWHFVNTERVRAAAEEGLSRTEPQVITYDTEMELAAVEWAVPADAVEAEPDLFDDADADAEEHWHTHESFTHVFADGSGSQTPPSEISFDAWTTSDNWSAFRPPDPDLSPGTEMALKWGVESPDADQGDESRIVDVAATHPAIVTLHAWVHRENPEGVFHGTHPEVAGGGEDHH